MAHWGWYWRVKNKQHIPRKLCSKLTSIDSFAVFKSGKCAGFTVQPLQIFAQIKSDSLRITYRNHQTSSYCIPFEKQPCNYGGFRYFFRCPLCQKRMRFLYLAENSIFLCRKCLNLSYETQRMRPSKRLNHKQYKVKQLIKERGGDIELNKKPPRMHDSTYQELTHKEFYYICKAHQASNAELRCWYGNKIEPYLDKFCDYIPDECCPNHPLNTDLGQKY